MFLFLKDRSMKKYFLSVIPRDEQEEAPVMLVDTYDPEIEGFAAIKPMYDQVGAEGALLTRGLAMRILEQWNNKNSQDIKPISDFVILKTWLDVHRGGFVENHID